MEGRISAQEIGEWIEFYELEPWGFEANCFEHGITAATVANVHRDSKKRQKPYSAVEFVPGYKPPKRDPRVIAAELKAMFAGMAARQKVKHEPKMETNGGKGDGEGSVRSRPSSGGANRNKRFEGWSKANRGGSKKAGPKE